MHQNDQRLDWIGKLSPCTRKRAGKVDWADYESLIADKAHLQSRHDAFFDCGFDVTCTTNDRR